MKSSAGRGRSNGKGQAAGLDVACLWNGMEASVGAGGSELCGPVSGEWVLV